MSQKKGICQNCSYFIYHSAMLMFIFFIFMSNCQTNVWAADIYVDPDYSGTESGTFAQPYNSWTDFTISAGNDYRQKAGTNWIIGGSYSINASGIAENYILIGAYYDDGGSPVHEDDNPSFGEFCGNGVAKPKITRTNNDADFLFVNGDYIEINSIQIYEGRAGIRANGIYQKIQYVRIMGGWSGIRVGLGSSIADNIYIGHNYLWTDYGSAPSLDGIQIASSNAIVEYNYINGYSHSGISTFWTTSDSIVRYNEVYSWDDHMDQFFTPDGTNHKFYHNYGNDCGIIQMGSASGVEIAYNIIDGMVRNPYFFYHKGAIAISPYTQANGHVIDCKIHNNIVYDRKDPNAGTTWSGIKIYGFPESGIVERNEIYNNIFLDMWGNASGNHAPPIYVLDRTGTIESDPADPDVNIFRNNVAYGHQDPNYAYIEGTTYGTAALFNSGYDAAYNNRDNDPGLKSPVNSQFWPDSSTDDVVGNGYDGGDYDQILGPFGTVWGAAESEAVIILATQPESHYIGAYCLPEKTSTLLPPIDLKIK